MNGLLHGCSLDGAPSLAPALVLTTWRSVISFLASILLRHYGSNELGNWCSCRGDRAFRRSYRVSQLPKQLSLGSSTIAILIGVYWIITAASV